MELEPPKPLEAEVRLETENWTGPYAAVAEIGPASVLKAPSRAGYTARGVTAGVQSVADELRKPTPARVIP